MGNIIVRAFRRFMEKNPHIVEELVAWLISEAVDAVRNEPTPAPKAAPAPANKTP